MGKFILFYDESIDNYTFAAVKNELEDSEYIIETIEGKVLTIKDNGNYTLSKCRGKAFILKPCVKSFKDVII